MIIARYITRQILSVTAALTFILISVVVLGRMLTYLGQASEGKIDSSVLVLLMSYRLPEFIQLTLPLSLALGILLAFGKLYADSEITVLSACGISRRQLLGLTAVPAGVVMLLVGVLSLKVTPWGLVNAETLLEAQKELTEFDVLVPGIFLSLSGGERTTYTESSRNSRLENIFMREASANRVTVASTAEVSEDDEGQRIVLMSSGSVTQGLAGQESVSVTRFEEFGVRMPAREFDMDITLEEKARPSSQLLVSDLPEEKAELQWRLSLMLMIPVLVLLVVPLSKVSPRQGRFARLVPAILLYNFYFGLLLTSRDLLADATLPAMIGLWWVHVLFLAIGLYLCSGRAPAWLGGD